MRASFASTVTTTPSDASETFPDTTERISDCSGMGCETTGTSGSRGTSGAGRTIGSSTKNCHRQPVRRVRAAAPTVPREQARPNPDWAPRRKHCHSLPSVVTDGSAAARPMAAPTRPTRCAPSPPAPKHGQIRASRGKVLPWQAHRLVLAQPPLWEVRPKRALHRRTDGRPRYEKRTRQNVARPSVAADKPTTTPDERSSCFRIE